MVFLGFFKGNRHYILFNNAQSISKYLKTLRFNVEIVVSPVENFFDDPSGFERSHHDPYVKVWDLSVFMEYGVKVLGFKLILFLRQ